MTTATTTAQELITCDLNCVKPVQQFCNSCQVGLCEDCINKHVKGLKSIKHDIVPFRKRTVQLVFPQCTSHSHQRCEGHCQQCDVPVCITCLLDSHKGHDVEAIADIIDRKRENIKRETDEIESSIIPKIKSCDADAEKKFFMSTAYYSDLENEAKDKRKKWHLEVDNIFDKLESLIQSRNYDPEVMPVPAQKSKFHYDPNCSRKQNNSRVQQSI
ncbi:tripartite motif-containing protein 45-like [Ostrea edulis]|uniref:tripartite motif-containing protein 45-like n=1 Tax=Ostrea edulis TaxID=37623 RepID=UPI0024AFFF96|nr:tripartite motif-containing protein 45-like [Ostrea edulis]